MSAPLQLFQASRRRDGSRPGRALSFALAIALAATPLAARGDLTDAISDPWRWIRFEEADGLPPGGVRCLADTGDVVWVGTNEGLYRYDGWRFEAVPVDEEPRPITAAAVDGEGGLWIACQEVLYVRERGRETFEVRWSAPAGTTIFELQVAEEGLLLRTVGPETRRSQRLFLVTEQVRSIPPPRSAQGVPHPLRHAWTTSRGRLWAAAPGALHRWEAGAWHREGPAELLDTVALAENRKGQGIAACTFRVNGRGLLEWGPDEPPRRRDDELYGLVNALAIAPGGEALVVYDTREVRVREDGEWQSPADPPEALLNARSLWFRGGTDLWVGTDDGLWLGRLGVHRWRFLKEPGLGNPHNRVNDLVVARDGSIWMATGRGVIVRDAAGRRLDVPTPDGTAESSLTGIAEDAQGRIWISSGSTMMGSHRWDGRRWEHVTRSRDGKPLGLFHKIRRDRTGRLWFLSLTPTARDPLVEERGGVYVLEGSELSNWPHAAALPPARVYDFQETTDGAYWFATMEGISRFVDGEWLHVGKSDGLTRSRVFDLEDDGRGGVWFVQQGFELGHVDRDGSVRYRPAAAGRLWSVVQSDDGVLWIGSNRGLLRYADGVFATLGLSSGLVPPKVWPVLPDGDRVLVGTMGGGLGILRLEEQDAPAPSVTITETSVDGDTLHARWRPNAWWGAMAPETIETRYRIDGGPWTDWSTDHAARRQGLGHGDHALEVQAKGLFGALRDEPAGASFHLALPVHRHPLLIALVALLLITFAFLLAGLVRRRYERAAELRRSEAEHRALIEQASDAIFLCDAETICRKANLRALELTGRERSEIVGAPLASICTDPDAFREFHDHILDGVICVAEFALVRPDGEEMIAEFGARQMFDGRIHLIARDVTARRRLEEQRRLLERHVTDAQRRESLAVLAGGVAHDFNNMLLVVSGNAEATLERVADDEVAREQLGRILAAVRQASALTHQLLAYTGREPVETRCVDLRAIVRDMDTLLRASIGPSVTLKLDTGDEPLPVEGDVPSLRQALLSLVTNASEAIGTQEGLIRVRTCGDEHRVRLIVEDTGPGMDEEVRPRAFDPFQSTRGPGRGLGLAAVRGIAASHGGEVAIEDPPGFGCTLVVTLPRSSRSPEPEQVLAPSDWTPTGNVLIVDDEHSIRDVLSVMVERMGFGVVTAAGGEEAIAAFAREHDFVCALVDLSMPKMSGLEVLEALGSLRPEVPTILMSGYSEDMFDVRRNSAAGLLRKPFSYDELRARLVDAVGEASRRDLVGPHPSHVNAPAGF